MNVFLVALVVFGSNIQAEVADAASNAIALNTSNVSDNIIDVKTSGRSEHRFWVFWIAMFFFHWYAAAQLLGAVARK